MNHHLLTRLGIVALLLAGAYPAVAQAADDDQSIEERREEARIERLWNLNWRQFTPYFLEHEGAFICVPSYERNKPSSKGQSLTDYRSDSVWNQTYKDERGNETSRKLTKPEEDAFAAVALLPDVAVGQYGYIRSGNVKEIIDSKTVELEDIWLVDADAVREEKKELKEKLWGQTLEDIEDAIREGRRGRGRGWGGRSARRIAENDALDWGFEAREEAIEKQRDGVYSRYTWVIKGFATDRLKEDARWPSANAKGDGLQLIIVKIDGRTVTAVPVASLRKGITELQFIDYLQSRELNKTAFVQIVTEAKREHRSDYAKHVLAALLGEEAIKSPDEVNNEVELAD